MPWPSLLLRILLSLTLLVSSSGNAVAASNLPMTQAGQALHAHTGQAGHTPDCPPGATANEPAMCTGEHCAADASVWPDAPAQPDQPDCCNTGHCGDYCAQHTSAALPTLWSGALPLMGRAWLGHILSAHPAPPLPSPQRPPIA